MSQKAEAEPGAAETRRFLLTIQYLGTRYAGWQTQTNAIGIQPIVETALATLARSPVRLHAAGRTDAGVHAAAQTAHVDLPASLPPQAIIRGGNNLLPRDIRITTATPVPSSFHARFDAKTKTYRYAIWNAEAGDVFHVATQAHVEQPLDAGLMSEAAARLEGEHDFRTFTVLQPEVSSTVRMITSIELLRRGAQISIDVTADGFLRYMVRRIAGLLIEVGRGRVAPDDAAKTVEPNFDEARWTAPACGLTLLRVDY